MDVHGGEAAAARADKTHGKGRLEQFRPMARTGGRLD
jgi:hypothetical protein